MSNLVGTRTEKNLLKSFAGDRSKKTARKCLQKLLKIKECTNSCNI